MTAVAEVETEQRVTSLELFFDLVFVVASRTSPRCLRPTPTWRGGRAGCSCARSTRAGRGSPCRCWRHGHPRRLWVAVPLVAAIPLAPQVSRSSRSALLSAVLCGLIAYEAIRFADARDRIRDAAER